MAWLTGAGFIAGAVAIAWAVYFLMRAVAARATDDASPELAGSVIFRVSALHGLILALVFAQETQRFDQIQTTLMDEATAVADIYNDIARFGGPQRVAVQADLTQYVRLVTGEEWQKLEVDGRLAPAAWAVWDRVYGAVLDLAPDTPRREALRAHMLADVQTIAAARQARELRALHGLSPLFWLAAVAGVVLVAAPYFVFAPTVLNLFLLSVYGAFSGLIIYIIFAFSDPFAPPGELRPTAFLRLLETEIGAPPTP